MEFHKRGHSWNGSHMKAFVIVLGQTTTWKMGYLLRTGHLQVQDHLRPSLLCSSLACSCLIHFSVENTRGMIDSIWLKNRDEVEVYIEGIDMLKARYSVSLDDYLDTFVCFCKTMPLMAPTGQRQW